MSVKLAAGADFGGTVVDEKGVFIVGEGPSDRLTAFLEYRSQGSPRRQDGHQALPRAGHHDSWPPNQLRVPPVPVSSQRIANSAQTSRRMSRKSGSRSSRERRGLRLCWSSLRRTSRTKRDCRLWISARSSMMRITLLVSGISYGSLSTGTITKCLSLYSCNHQRKRPPRCRESH